MAECQRGVRKQRCEQSGAGRGERAHRHPGTQDVDDPHRDDEQRCRPDRRRHAEQRRTGCELSGCLGPGPRDGKPGREDERQRGECLRHQILLEHDQIAVKEHNRGRGEGERTARPGAQEQRIDEGSDHEPSGMLDGCDDCHLMARQGQDPDQQRVTARPIRLESHRTRAVGEPDVRPGIRVEQPWPVRRRAGDARDQPYGQQGDEPAVRLRPCYDGAQPHPPDGRSRRASDS